MAVKSEQKKEEYDNSNRVATLWLNKKKDDPKFSFLKGNLSYKIKCPDCESELEVENKIVGWLHKELRTALADVHTDNIPALNIELSVSSAK